VSAGIVIVLIGSDDQDYFSAETLESGFLERVIDFSTNSRRRREALCWRRDGAERSFGCHIAISPFGAWLWTTTRNAGRSASRGIRHLDVNERSGDPRL